MFTSFAVPTPLEYFASLVGDDSNPTLLEAAASIAQDVYPKVDVQAVLLEVDQLIVRLRQRIAQDASPLHRVKILNHYFFKELHFGGNVNDYYDPDNSFIHVVLQTRRGIPISLGVIWLELARAIGLRASGVNFPGHFLVKVALPEGQALFDPMTGQSLSRENLLELVEPYRESGSEWDEAAEIPLGLFLQTAPARDILARMLRNLKEIYQTNHAGERLLAVQNRLLLLQPETQ